MNFKDCVDFANAHPMCALATVEGDQPHVRTVMMDQADETGFYFSLVVTKQVYKQLKANPKAEICWFNNAADFGQIKQLRATGKLEEFKDAARLEKAYAPRQGLEQLVGKPIKNLIVLFRLTKGEAHFWTIMNALKEDQIERLQF